MNRIRRAAVLTMLTAVVVCSDALLAGTPSFQSVRPETWWWPIRASAVSSDGTAIVGQGFFLGNNNDAYRWRLGEGFTVIPSTMGAYARGVSTDGSVIVGDFDEAVNRPYRWSAATGAVALPVLPGGTGSSAHGVSGDGTITVGQSDSSVGFFAVKWTASTGLTSLGDLPGGTQGSGARAVSADGSTIVGFGTSAGGEEAMRYVGGVMSGLGDLPGGEFRGYAEAVSANGSVIVGRGSSVSGAEAFRWDGAMVGLGDLPGGAFASTALGVSSDGNTIVGRATIGAGNAAFIWDPANGMRDLQAYLSIDLDLDLQGMTLRDAVGISADGTVIVGNGLNAAGVETVWRAVIPVIPEPSTLALLVFSFAVVCRRVSRPRQSVV